MNSDLGSRPTGGPSDGPAGDIGDGLPERGDRSDEAGPIGTRLGHDPSELGKEVADEGDLVYPTPEHDSPKSM